MLLYGVSVQVFGNPPQVLEKCNAATLIPRQGTPATSDCWKSPPGRLLRRCGSKSRIEKSRKRNGSCLAKVIRGSDRMEDSRPMLHFTSRNILWLIRRRRIGLFRKRSVYRAQT